jgi:hypothetical protein
MTEREILWGALLLTLWALFFAALVLDNFWGPRSKR